MLAAETERLAQPLREARHGLAALYREALISLTQQWMLHVFVESAEQRSVGRMSLLAGQYVIVSQGGLTPLELMRGLVLSVLLFTAFCSTESPARSETFRLQPGHPAMHCGGSSTPKATKRRT